MIKAVVFDIDGVLLNSFEANLKFFQDLMTKVGYRPPTREEFPPIFHLSMMDAIKTLTKSTSDEEIKQIWETGRSRKIKYHLELLTMPEKAGEVIETLSKIYSLGIVTSRIKESVYEAPALAKLQKYFKVTISYQDTINHKPHPEPLLLACQKLNISPREAVYIGDVENDIVAGKAAGMKVIIFSQSQYKNVDAITSQFEKLPELIKSLA
ncbi:MAG: HAD family hydrolase [Candidatus Curtissbacteria bacterium]|nr:HAD family hydrolase [Candidatus Curtissbacteria bacterium]